MIIRRKEHRVPNVLFDKEIVIRHSKQSVKLEPLVVQDCLIMNGNFARVTDFAF